MPVNDRLTDAQRDALSSALAEVGLKLEAAFGRCGIVLIAKPLQSEGVGVISNMPPQLASHVVYHAIFDDPINVRDAVVPMKPLADSDD